MTTPEGWDPEDPLNFFFGDDGYSDLLIFQSPEVLGTDEPVATAEPPSSGHSTQPSEVMNTVGADLALLSVAGSQDVNPVAKQPLLQPQAQQPQAQQPQPQPQPQRPQPQQPQLQTAARDSTGQRKHPAPQLMANATRALQAHQAPQQMATQGGGVQTQPASLPHMATAPAPALAPVQGAGPPIWPLHVTGDRFPSSSFSTTVPYEPALYFSPEKGLQPMNGFQAGMPNSTAQTPAARLGAGSLQLGMGGPSGAIQPLQPPPQRDLSRDEALQRLQLATTNLFGGSGPLAQYGRPLGGQQASTFFEGILPDDQARLYQGSLGGDSYGYGSATPFDPSFSKDQSSSVTPLGSGLSQSTMGFNGTQQPPQMSSDRSSLGDYAFGAESSQYTQPSGSAPTASNPYSPGSYNSMSGCSYCVPAHGAGPASPAYPRAGLPQSGTGMSGRARRQAGSLAGLSAEAISFHGLPLPSLRPAPYPPGATLPRGISHADVAQRPTSWSKEAHNMYFRGWSNAPPRR